MLQGFTLLGGTMRFHNNYRESTSAKSWQTATGGNIFPSLAIFGFLPAEALASGQSLTLLME